MESKRARRLPGIFGRASGVKTTTSQFVALAVIWGVLFLVDQAR
jgi:hypothetical protein